jgi:hypothetical protein
VAETPEAIELRGYAIATTSAALVRAFRAFVGDA